jgi:hypothetical protein
MIGKVVKPCKTEVVDFISNRIKMTQTTCFLGKTMNKLKLCLWFEIENSLNYSGVIAS